MARPRPRRPERWLAPPALGLLAALIGLLLANADPATQIGSAVQLDAERAVAVRMVLGAAEEQFTARSAPPPPRTYPLLDGEQTVRLASAATRIRIPSAGIDAEVRSVGLIFRDGALRYDTPRFEAGQYIGSAPLGVGNTVIAGHVSNRGAAAVFSALPGVQLGETVEVFRGEELFRYRITEVRLIDPGAVAVMAPTGDARVTLITCSTDAGNTQRIVVVGQFIGRVS